MWARDATTSFLRPPAEMRALIEAAGFRALAWEDVTAELAGPSTGAAVPAHGIARIVMGEAIDDIMRVQVAKLNVRIGDERIVKVISKSPVSGFPASPFRRVPQWNLKVLKAFDRIRDVGKTLGFTLDFSCSLLQQKLDIEPVE
jgi:hypothetical protein